MIFMKWFVKKETPPEVYSVLNDHHVRFYAALTALKYIKENDYEGIRLLMKNIRNILVDDFNHEEHLMSVHHYCEKNIHKLHHDMVINIIDVYSNSEGILDKDEVVAHIKAWMVQHTKYSDKKLQNFLFNVNRRLLNA